jgi:hypothetical protein
VGSWRRRWEVCIKQLTIQPQAVIDPQPKTATSLNPQIGKPGRRVASVAAQICAELTQPRRIARFARLQKICVNLCNLWTIFGCGALVLLVVLPMKHRVKEIAELSPPLMEIKDESLREILFSL